MFVRLFVLFLCFFVCFFLSFVLFICVLYLSVRGEEGLHGMRAHVDGGNE